MSIMEAGKPSMQSEINVTPMIDVLLVLLIIFMVIVPIASRGELAAAPHPAAHHTPQNAVVLQVLKDSQGKTAFRINQQAVTLENLRARLAEIYANRAQRVLFIKGDDELSFREIAEAIDISHAAGIDRVGLITPNVSRGL